MTYPIEDTMSHQISQPDGQVAEDLAALVADGHAREARERAARERAEDAATQLANLLADKITEASSEHDLRLRAEQEVEHLRERVLELRESRRPRRRFAHRARLASTR